MLARVDTRPRRKNSRRTDADRRFPTHLQWVRGRECYLAGRHGHVCEGKIEASHSDADGTKGLALKSADYHAVPLCAGAHRQLHQIGLETWQRTWGVNHAAAGRAYGAKSPKKALWAHVQGAPR